MTNTEAVELAQKLIAQHGLELEITTSNAKKALGRCFFRNGRPVRIDLSSYWTNRLPESEVRDTILHEIAHALAGVKAGHGPEWKAAAVKVGANPKRLVDLPEELMNKIRSEISNYIAVCRNSQCKNEVYFDRMTKNWKYGHYVCPKCHSGFTVYSNQ